MSQRWAFQCSAGFTCEDGYALNHWQYLFRRLKEVGVNSVHGLPGDYNLVALDYVSKVGLHWVGNCNELNAGM
jgi:TPP-dependent 2-oxoacid decarboxylase